MVYHNPNKPYERFTDSLESIVLPPNFSENGESEGTMPRKKDPPTKSPHKATEEENTPATKKRKRTANGSSSSTPSKKKAKRTPAKTTPNKIKANEQDEDQTPKRKTPRKKGEVKQKKETTPTTSNEESYIVFCAVDDEEIPSSQPDPADEVIEEIQRRMTEDGYIPQFSSSLGGTASVRTTPNHFSSPYKLRKVSFVFSK